MKRFVKVIKRLGIALAGVVLLAALFLLGVRVWNGAMLKKEAALISHKGQYVEVDGHNMNLYIEGGGDRTLVFMAGSGIPSPYLEYKPLYSRLSDEYRIVVIEKFGYGYSDEVDGERTVDILLEQDREALRKAGIDGPYILCPHSASGLEAVLWANTYPDEVEAIIGLDMAVPEQYDYMGVKFDKADALTPEQWNAQMSSFFFILRSGLMRVMYNIEDALPASASADLTADERAEYKAITYAKYSLAEDMTMYHEQWTTEHFMEVMQGICDGPVPDVPTLLLVSDGSMMEASMGADNWKLIQRDYIDGLSDAKLVQLDCGHYIYIEEPDVVASEMRSFIDTLDKE